MANEHFEQLYWGVVSLKSSVDAYFRLPRRRSGQDVRNSYKAVALQLEAIRVDLNFVRRGGVDPTPDFMEKAQADLGALVADPAFDMIAHNIRFRASPGGPRGEQDLPALRREMSVFDAAEVLLRHIRDVILGPLFVAEGAVEAEAGVAALRKIIPEQKLAPAMFDVANGKLVLVKRAADAGPDDAENARNAKEKLLDRGERIIEALEKSNCDRRLLESVREVQEGLRSQEDIISLGLMNLGLERVCESAASELPDAIVGTLSGHTRGIAMYVAQFPDWQRFAENAASVELNGADVERIAQAAEAVVEQLNERPDIAEPEVPKTIKALRALIADPKSASKRAAFAVLRTIENLVAKVLEYGADLLDKTAKKTLDDLSVAASTVLVGTLMALAVAATAHLGGVTGKVLEASWMKTAAEIVKKQIEAAAPK